MYWKTFGAEMYCGDWCDLNQKLEQEKVPVFVFEGGSWRLVSFSMQGFSSKGICFGFLAVIFLS